MFRQQAFTGLNLLGLSVGLAATLLMVAYVYHQYSFDRFHQKADRLYHASAQHSYGDQLFNVSRFSPAFGAVMQQQVPGIAQFVRTDPKNNVILSTADGVEKHTEDRFFFVDSNFLQVFSFNLLQGRPDEVLRTPFSIVLTPAMAVKYFGNTDPLGKTLELTMPNSALMFESTAASFVFTVSGVIAGAPGNSSIQYDFLASMSSQRSMTPTAFESQLAQLGFLETYFLLEEGQDAEVVGQRLNIAFNEGKDETGVVFIHTLPESHFSEARQKKLGLFIGIAFLILLLAIVNYASLTTARATQRAKEVGVRKTLGARRGQLMGQFFGESLLMVLLAFSIALLLCRIALPLINQLADARIDFQVFGQPGLILATAAVLLLSVFLAGSYPALVLSRFRPALSLRSGHGTLLQGERTRRVLLVFQFVISAALIVCSLVMESQMRYLGKRDLGFKQDQLLVIPFEGKQEGSFGALRSILAQEPGVLNAGISTSVPFHSEGTNIFFANTPAGDPISLYVTSVDHGFLSTLGLEWSAGELAGLSLFGKGERVILNETAYRQLGLQTGLGERILNGNIGGETGLEVSGVVKDYTFSDYKNEIGPQIMIELSEDVAQNLSSSGFITLRLAPGLDVQQTIARFQESYERFADVQPFNFFFVDDAYDQLYRFETRSTVLFRLFTGLAVLIACLGLLGLSAFLAERRTKEIGIRKVFGATASSIISLLSKDFLYLVSIALLLAFPVAWYLMKQWLADFAFRIELDASFFVLAAILAIGLAFLTVGLQSLRAALANPVDSLRSE